jgi:hypothetical protein
VDLRKFTRTERPLVILLVALAALNLADVLTSALGLRLGAIEAMPRAPCSRSAVWPSCSAPSWCYASCAAVTLAW